MLVSPGVVMASAPCAAPYCTASCGRLACEEAVNQAGGETVAAADAVVDFQILAQRRFVEFAAGPADRAPVVEGGGLGIAQGGGDGLEVGVHA